MYNKKIQSKKIIQNTLLLLFCLMFFLSTAKNPDWEKKIETEHKTKAEACTPATGKMDLDINNVRCRIMTGGDMWWDLISTALYEIPKGSSKCSMFCASLWIAGVDVNGQLKCAAQRYRDYGNDYWPGPLTTDGTASIDPETCNQYDKFFKITRAEVDAFIADWKDNGKIDDTIPRDILEWPAHGDISKGQSYYLAPFYDNNGDGKYNPYDGDYPYYDVTGSLCSSKTLTKTMEENGILKDQILKGDQTLWWVFNDKGNIHTETGGDAIGMEIRAQAFAFATNDDINNMTFYSYELVNRSTYRLSETYFSQWVDPDLGYNFDDYVGCDVKRGLGYCYNGYAVDGTGRPNEYGAQPPAVGVDFFQGPYMDPSPDGKDRPAGGCDESINGVGFGDGIPNNERFGMRRFVYYNNDASVTGEPLKAIDYYNYLRGIWKDGTKMVYGGNAHITDPSDTRPQCDFMFPGDSDPCNWGTGGAATGFPVGGQYWTEEQAGNKPWDRRFMQSAGPFTLEPGAVNYITVGIPWARAASGGPWGSVELLKQVDDKCQNLFNNCFQIVEGPDAPDLVIQELDKKLILYISNRKTNSNATENYTVYDPNIISPDTLPYVTSSGVVYTRFDSLYRFEGYQIFQLQDATVSIADINDPSKATLVAQCDIKNGVSKLINYNYDAATGANIPVVEVDGADNGISHTFVITTDAFATGDNTLVNYKQYYFIAIAYAYNQFLPFSEDPAVKNGLFGQKQPYLPSRKNQSGGAIAPVTGIPHKTEMESKGTYLQSSYGDTPEITRLEGNGNGGRILDLTDETINEILAKNFSANPTYKKSLGPINIKIIDPLNVVSANYTLKFNTATDTIKPVKDSIIFFNYSVDTTNSILVKRWFWTLTDVDTRTDYKSDMDIEKIFKYYNKKTSAYTNYDTIRTSNEQLFIDLGLSVTIQQKGDEKQYSTNIQPFKCTYFIDSNTGKQILQEYNLTEWDYQKYVDKIVNVNFLEATISYSDSSKKWLGGVHDDDNDDPNNWIRSGMIQDANYDQTKEDYYTFVMQDSNCDQVPEITMRLFWDPNQNFANILNGTWSPAKLASCYQYGMMPEIYYYAYLPFFRKSLMDSIDFRQLNSVDILITPDKSKWSRCPVIEMSEDTTLSEGNQSKFCLRKHKNVGQDGTSDGTTNADGSDYGMSWFPGYAINVETGERLNIMFGEDSWLTSDNGNDMIWNPTSNLTYLDQVIFGGKHFVYIMGHNGNDTTKFCPIYDEGAWCHANLLKANNPSKKDIYQMLVYKDVMWIGATMLAEGQQLLSNELKIRIRVGKPYRQYYNFAGDGATPPANNNYPMYSLSTKGMETKTNVQDTAKNALDLINIVPNPYYGFSEYETNQLDNRVKITNLPQTCTISIYTINGILIRQITKDDSNTYVDWDLKNHAGIPIAGGVYIIYIKANGIGEKVIKWFGALRPVDLNTY